MWIHFVPVLLKYSVRKPRFFWKPFLCTFTLNSFFGRFVHINQPLTLCPRTSLQFNPHVAFGSKEVLARKTFLRHKSLQVPMNQLREQTACRESERPQRRTDSGSVRAPEGACTGEGGRTHGLQFCCPQRPIFRTQEAINCH